MKPKRSEIKYEDYKLLIAKMAWQWSRRSGLEWEELMGQGNLAFVQARNRFETFKKSKPAFSTFLVNFLERRYIVIVNCSMAEKRTFESSDFEFDSKSGENKWVVKKTSEPADIEVDSLMSRNCSPERIVAFKEMVNNLSKDAQTLVECILETPKELAWMAGHHGQPIRMTLYMLEKYFTQKRGWPIYHFRKVSKEIHRALAEL